MRKGHEMGHSPRLPRRATRPGLTALGTRDCLAIGGVICYISQTLCQADPLLFAGLTMPLPESVPKVPRTLAREDAYNKLRGWIIDGTLKPEGDLCTTTRSGPRSG